MTTVTVPLFDRLPEIYRVRDAEQSPPDQLRAYLAAVELAFGALHDHIAQLYDDLFIDTCDDWVIPYLADLLGTTHLKGEPRTLRADVADTIALRRRKGTLGAVERLAVNLSGWACRAVELRDNLSWAQHLNHQRPDAGGEPPYGDARLIALGYPLTPRGGTAPLRDPAALALLGTPFDNFAYTADIKPGDAREHPADARRINLPNLAVFLWRLAAYRLRLMQPLAKGATDLGPQPAGLARFAVRFDLHPLDLPVVLFNTSRPGFVQASTSGGVVSPLTEPDAVPGPMLDARLTGGTEAGHPEAYVAIGFFDDAPVPPTGFDLGDVGLNFFLPLSQQPVFATTNWLFRGDNLCAWETGLRRPLRDGELVIDPDIGRVLFGVGNPAQRDALVDAAGTTPRIYASFTYGAVGPVGAHPVSRSFGPVSGTLRRASALPGGASLQSQLVDLDIATQPVVIQIDDSLVHRQVAVPAATIRPGAAGLAVCVGAACTTVPVDVAQDALRAVSSDGAIAAVAGADGRVSTYDVATGKRIARFRPRYGTSDEDGAHELAFVGHALAAIAVPCAGPCGRATLYSARGQRLGPLPIEASEMMTRAIAGDAWLVTSIDDNLVIVDAATGKILVNRELGEYVATVAGTRVVVAVGGQVLGRLVVLDAAGREVATVDAPRCPAAPR